MPFKEGSEKAHHWNNNEPHDSLSNCFLTVEEISGDKIDKDGRHDGESVGDKIKDEPNDELF